MAKDYQFSGSKKRKKPAALRQVIVFCYIPNTGYLLFGTALAKQFLHLSQLIRRDILTLQQCGK